MTTATRFVGLDYHQDSIQVCVMNQEGEILVNRKTGNEAVKVEKIIRETALQDSKEVTLTAKISIEACSGAANLSEELMLNAGRDVRLATEGLAGSKRDSPTSHTGAIPSTESERAYKNKAANSSHPARGANESPRRCECLDNPLDELAANSGTGRSECLCQRRTPG